VVILRAAAVEDKGDTPVSGRNLVGLKRIPLKSLRRSFSAFARPEFGSEFASVLRLRVESMLAGGGRGRRSDRSRPRPKLKHAVRCYAIARYNVANVTTCGIQQLRNVCHPNPVYTDQPLACCKISVRRHQTKCITPSDACAPPAFGQPGDLSCSILRYSYGGVRQGEVGRAEIQDFNLWTVHELQSRRFLLQLLVVFRVRTLSLGHPDLH